MTKTNWLELGIIVGIFGGAVLFARLSLSAWHEERDHAAFLYDCCHFDDPNVCENKWLSQLGAR